MANGWNRPSASSQPEAKKGGVKSPSVLKGVIVGAVAVVVGVVCIFVFSGKSEKPVKDTGTKPAKIKEVTPAVTNVVEKAPVDPLEDYDHEKCYRDERGILRYKKGGAYAHDPATLPKDATKIGYDSKGNPIGYKFPFKNYVDSEIACLLTMRPGMVRHGARVYDARFEAAFKKSLEEPIIVTDEDSPRDAEIKRQVKATKIEICDRIAAGERLADILNETKSELDRLARCRRDIEELVRTGTADPDMTDEDFSDYIAAANKMLAEKGLEPIKGGPITRRNIRLGRLKGNKGKETK